MGGLRAASRRHRCQVPRRRRATPWFPGRPLLRGPRPQLHAGRDVHDEALLLYCSRGHRLDADCAAGKVRTASAASCLAASPPACLLEYRITVRWRHIYHSTIACCFRQCLLSARARVCRNAAFVRCKYRATGPFYRTGPPGHECVLCVIPGCCFHLIYVGTILSRRRQVHATAW